MNTERHDDYNSDEKLKMAIFNDKNELGWEWKEISDNMGIGEKRGNYLKLIVSDKKRKIPKWLKETLKDWHEKVRPTLLSFTAAVWPWKYEPVAFATLSTTIPNALAEMKRSGAKALVVTNEENARPIAILLRENLDQISGETKDKKPYPTVFEFIGKATRNFSKVDSSDSYRDVRFALRERPFLLFRDKDGKITSVLTREPRFQVELLLQTTLLRTRKHGYPKRWQKG